MGSIESFKAVLLKKAAFRNSSDTRFGLVLWTTYCNTEHPCSALEYQTSTDRPPKIVG